MPLIDQFWGDRAGSVTDPEGLNWWIATRQEDLTKDEMDQRAAEFFKNMPQPAHS
jgi:PhnB protein